ncbi:MAG: DotA/TraY family protein [Rhodospirillales bacterium]|nr:DotA/TraY family protein [Rhodospirillales bacterium]MCB9996141.1 DotA/TraY family protein [Rhodospirillales bacterium]
MDITTGKILRYTMLPGIVPRIMDFFSSGFSHIALYLSYVYRTVRLLPAGHPYLNPANIGQYGIRHVIFEARRNLVFKKENADQVIIFFTILLGIVLLFLQFAFLIAGFMIPAANAGLGDEIGDYVFLSNFFSITPAAATYDIAYRLMDLTFGFKNPYAIFNSCAIQGVMCQLAFTPGGGFVPVGPTYSVPTQFHLALHTLFNFYNIGILVVGFMVMMYMFATVVAETAQSGTPFGKRFNRLWAPIRLVIAIALLTPLAFGLNGAQLLTLMMAKWGSNMATNAWQEFMFDINGFGTTLLGDPATLVARPNAPPVNNVIEMTFVALTCQSAERLLNKRDDVTNPEVKAWLIYGKDQSVEFVPTAFAAALSNAINGDPDTNNGDIILRFGPKDPVQYERYSGHVKPLCGEIAFQTKDINQPGALQMQEHYYELVKDLWTDGLQIFYANNIALRYMPVATRDPLAQLPDNNYIEGTLSWFNADIPVAIDAARLAQIGATWNEDFTTLGWAGAAIWYQKVAEYTGGFFSAVNGVPTPNLYPAVMEHVRDQRRMHDDFTSGLDRFDPVMSGGNMVEFENAQDPRMAAAYFYAQSFWNVQYKETGGSSMLDSVIAMFGLSGLINIHKNLDIHPLAQLVGIGRSLIESAVTNLGFSFGAGVVGGLANILGKNLVESVAMAAASFAGQVALIGLSLGFILYYIVPFLPFIYFFFAVGGWIKGIFEAMVGLPLWALAHVRIDGEGLPGPAAMNGYFLIFEIFLRPLLIIFGLLAGIIIFASQVQVLNEIWQLVTSNLLGYDSDDLGASITPGTGAGVGPTVGSIEYLRNAADRLFYTVIYAIIVYMMAMASFKLVDLIPNNILRWMNASVSTFGEQAGDPAASLVQYSFMGSQLALGPMNSAMQGIAARAAPKI